MSEITSMFWIEMLKAHRSRMPLWTSLGGMFMPMAIAFLIFVSRNPQVSQKLGLISAKANLVAYAATDWPTYLNFLSMFVAAGGFFLFALSTSWIFGREFVDGTLKDLLAIPIPRASILAAKFILLGVWSLGLSLIMVGFGLVFGAMMNLPGGSGQILLSGAEHALIVALLTLAVTVPFAWFASAGRGYLLPLSISVLALMTANVSSLIGWAEVYPWAIPGTFAQSKETLPLSSYVIVLITSLLGIAATHLWWKHADQSR